MKHLLITITAVLLVGCGESKDSKSPESQTREATAEEETQPTLPIAETNSAESDTEVENSESSKTNKTTGSIHDAITEEDLIRVKNLLLRDKSNISKKNEDGESPLHTSLWIKNFEISEFLLNNQADVNVKANNGQTPLHVATLSGKKELVELLIANKVDVNSQDVAGQTPLYIATRLASISGNNDIVDILKNNGGKTQSELKAEGK